ncbi:DNA polymerase epsilon subunit B, partial [Bienertia sinuspersici]
MGAITRQEVNKQFKLRRYTLQAAALQDVLSFVIAMNLMILMKLWIFSLIFSIKSLETINRVISAMLDVDEVSDSHSHLRFIDSFVVPKFRYDTTRKTFY